MDDLAFLEYNSQNVGEQKIAMYTDYRSLLLVDKTTRASIIDDRFPCTKIFQRNTNFVAEVYFCFSCKRAATWHHWKKTMHGYLNWKRLSKLKWNYLKMVPMFKSSKQWNFTADCFFDIWKISYCWTRPCMGTHTTP